MTNRVPRLRNPRGDRDLGRARPWESLLHLRPPWLDSTLARRVLAAALASLAVFLLLRGDPRAHRITAVVAARDLAPGRALAAADLRTAEFTEGALPAGVVHSPSALIGAILTAAMRPGEIFTDLRVVGPRLAHVATGTADARIVPIRLADNAVADILRPGDRVDVIAAEPDTPGEPDSRAPPHALAADAVVVSVPGAASGAESTGLSRPRASDERVVLLALDAQHATVVAAASLRTALTVTFQ
ncbi:RcpC/CpaB family pilus assembly protein [Nocardia alni]|uniref:RcpC/CpaB family pilus assembly protein n=1 Tax=Nocardia alni TaxID=2815723 RepID=UPI001C218A4D|nr:RcpC/CpaB family pilus assembly protein [Nocardia alni]